MAQGGVRDLVRKKTLQFSLEFVCLHDLGDSRQRSSQCRIEVGNRIIRNLSLNEVGAKHGVSLMQPSQVPDIAVADMGSKGHRESDKLVRHDFFHFFRAQKEIVISVREEIVVPPQRAQINCMGWDVGDLDL